MPAVIVTSPEELKETLAAVVRREVKSQIPAAIQEAQEPEWAGKDYVMDRFGWTSRQLTYLRNRERIRYSQHGRTILYHVPTLKEYLAKGTVKPRRGPLAEKD